MNDGSLETIQLLLLDWAVLKELRLDDKLWIAANGRFVVDRPFEGFMKHVLNPGRQFVRSFTGNTFEATLAKIGTMVAETEELLVSEGADEATLLLRYEESDRNATAIANMARSLNLLHTTLVGLAPGINNLKSTYRQHDNLNQLKQMQVTSMETLARNVGVLRERFCHVAGVPVVE